MSKCVRQAPCRILSLVITPEADAGGAWVRYGPGHDRCPNCGSSSPPVVYMPLAPGAFMPLVANPCDYLPCRELCMLALVLSILHSSCGLQPLVVLGVLMLGVQTWCWLEAAKRQEYIAGHRAGAKGYTGGLRLARQV